SLRGQRVEGDVGRRGVGNQGDGAAWVAHVARDVNRAAPDCIAALVDDQRIGPTVRPFRQLEARAVDADLDRGDTGGGIRGAAADDVDLIALEIGPVAQTLQ